MARDLATGASTPRRRALGRLWMLLLGIGVAAVVAGGLLIILPLIGVFSRGSADQSALNAWNAGGFAKVVGPAKGGTATTMSCGSSSSADYALVTFSGLPQYHYAGVAGDGTWDLLNQRSMVHYHGTPDPGQAGNVIIAFHREPDYQYIDQLNVGETITIQDRSCHTFVYQVTQRWDLPPSQVTQLVPTTGYDLTMITCNPWWQDYDRLVWRAVLVSPAPGSGSSFQSGSTPASVTPGQPSF